MIKILVPLDGSDFSTAILPQLCRFFTPASHQLILIRVLSMAEDVLGHAFDPLNTQPFDTQQWQDFVASSELNQTEMSATGATLKALKQSLSEALEHTASSVKAQGFETTCRLHFGDPATTIVSLAKEEQVNLIAMASHGRSGLSRLLMGSIAHDVLRQSHLPVMLIRPHLELAGQELERGLAFSLD